MNINRDYLIINDVKKSNIKLDNGSMFFYITDKNTQNIFVNLVINISNNDLIQKYANIENAEDYTLTMNIVKPSNTYKVIKGKLHDKEKAIFEFNLNEDCCDEIGTYRCELLTKCNINDHEEITTSNKITYKVKSSVLNDLDDIVEAPEYPLVIQLFDKLSDIEQYEEDRRANELARQLAEEQRQTKHDELVADITDRMTTMDNKVVEVEDRITAKEQAVDTLINGTKADIDDYKVAKDAERDEYKTAKDTEINNAITAQDNKIDTAISNQNDRIAVVENNDATQNARLDVLENRDTIHESRMTTIEAKNAEQDNRLDAIEAIDVAQNTRLDAIEAKNQQQDDRLLDIEKVNKRQDMNLKCLFAESKNNMIDVTEEGNSIYLQNSTTGYTLIDEIKGNTLVNCNKEPDKELILNGNINTSTDNTVTITEGVDGGLVDVALEGNTLVNVSKTKDSTAISKSYTVENSGNHIALQGDIDGSCRPVVTGKTLVNLGDVTDGNSYDGSIIIKDGVTIFDASKGSGYRELLNYTKINLLKPSTQYTIVIDILENTLKDTLEINYSGYNLTAMNGDIYIDKGIVGRKIFLISSKADLSSATSVITPRLKNTNSEGIAKFKVIILEGDYTNKPIPDYFTGLQSSFEDNLVTQEVVDSGEEVVDNLGKYRVDYKSTQEDGTVGSTKVLYLNSPLLEGDTIEEKDGDIYHVHRSELVAYTEGDETSLITDKVNTLHQLETPQYELIEQSNLVIPSYANGHLDFNTAVPVEKVEFKPFSEELTYLYANTQYTVQFVSDKAITADITLGGAQLLAQSIVKGLNRISITTPATLTDNKLVISGIANIMEVVVTDINRELIYFEGMKSVGEGGNLVITSSNSDNILSNNQTLTHAPLRAVGGVKDRYVLIDCNWYIERKCGIRAYQEGDKDNYKTDLVNTVYPLEMPTYEEIDYNPLEVYSGTTHITTNSVIPCNITVKNHGFNCLLKPSTTYTVSSNLGLNTVTTPSTLTEDCLRFMDTDTSDITTMKDVLVLEGDWTSKADLIPANFSGIESAFEQEYDAEKGKYKVNIKVANEDKSKENNITFYINEPLRGVGDVKDRVYVKDDKVVVQRNCGSVTFDGSKCTIYFSADRDKLIEFQCRDIMRTKGNRISLCDKFSNLDSGTAEKCVTANEIIYIQILKAKLQTQDIAGFKQWLQQNPVTVVYQLVEPTYEEVEYNDTKLFIESFKNSTLSYNSNVPVTSKLHYSYSVPIVDTVSQTANVTDQQDSMIIDLATQVAVMEMMLM